MIRGFFRYLRRLYAYQKARFPVFLLLISLVPAIVSSNAVITGNFDWVTTMLAALASIAYLFHIRVIDERRDADHDRLHHPDRPIQSGAITHDELCIADVLVSALFIGIAFFSSPYAFLLALLAMAYTYFAGQEFFLGEKIRKHFFFYNAINLAQMVLLQLFIYALFDGTPTLTPIIIVHFLFTATGTIAIEFMRKLKAPENEGTGMDTYTWHLGFERAVGVFIAIIVLSFGFSTLLVGMARIPFAICVVAGLIALLSVLYFLKTKKKHGETFLQLAFLLNYSACNIAIAIPIFLNYASA